MKVQRIAPIGSIVTHVQTKCSVCGHEWKNIVGARCENEKCSSSGEKEEMMRFEKTTDGEKVVIELHEHATIEEALDAFERFLLACSYKIPEDCHVGLIDES